MKASDLRNVDLSEFNGAVVNLNRCVESQPFALENASSEANETEAHRCVAAVRDAVSSLWRRAYDDERACPGFVRRRVAGAVREIIRWTPGLDGEDWFVPCLTDGCAEPVPLELPNFICPSCKHEE